METIAEKLAHWSLGLTFEDLPAPYLEMLEWHALDTVGVLLGATTLDYARNQARRAVAEGGSREATIFGDGRKVPARTAAFLNGCLGHGIDWDDTHLNALLHPTATILPAVLAVAEAEGLSGEEMMTGYAVGMESMVRLGLGAGRGLVKGCLHPTSMCGTFGVALAVSKLFQLNQEQTVNALGIAGGMCAGLHESVIDGSMNKCIHSGVAVQAGYGAAELARAGFTGPATIIEGPKGFLNAFVGAGNYDAEIILQDLGSRWFSDELAYKAYACCQGAHPSADLALQLYHEHGVRAPDIESVTVRVGSGVGRTLCEPSDVKRQPPSAYGAKFSIPYVIASALSDGAVVLETFSRENISDPERLALATSVEHVVDPYYDVGTALRGHLTVHLRDGREIVASTDACTGTPENPWQPDGIIAKFRLLADPIIGRDQSDRLVEHVVGMRHLLKVDEITDLVAVHPQLVQTA